MPIVPQQTMDHPALALTGLILALFFAVGLAMDVLLVGGLCTRRWTLRRRQRHPLDRDWKWSDAALLVLVLLGAQSIFGWAAARYGFPGGAAAGGPAIVVQTLLFHGLAGLLVVVLLRGRGLSWKTAFGARGAATGTTLRHALVGIALYIAALPPIIVLAALYRWGLRGLNVPLDPQPVIALFVASSTPLWLRIYLTAIAIAVAPVIEEMCFRGIALPLFRRAGGTAAGIVTVSLLFAAVHFHVPSAAPLFGIAVAFALGYLVTGSLITPIVMHALFNAVSVALLYVLKDSVPPW